MTRDLHTSTVSAAAAYEDAHTPWQPMTKAELAAEAGIDYPAAEHLALADDDPWMVALRESVADVQARLRGAA